MDTRSLGFRTDLMMRRLEGSEIADHGDYLVVRSPANPTYWWGNFLLLPEAALRGDGDGDGDGEGEGERHKEGDRVATWTSRFTAAFPDASHVALGIDTSDIDTPSIDTPGIDTSGTGAGLDDFAAAGFKVERDTVLTAEAVREPPHPNHEALVRPLQPESESDWRQSLELRRACHADDGGPTHSEFTARRNAQTRDLVRGGHGAWFGAFTDGRLAAQLGVFSDGAGIARYQGVETHPSARRQGLAGTLVYRAARYALAELGARTLVIVADPGYSAIRLYRAVGFADAEAQLSLERTPRTSMP